MYTLEEKIQRSLVRNLIKTHSRRVQGDFKPCLTSVRKLCDHINKPEYFDQIRNRVERACEENEALWQYVIIGIDDLEDVKLSADGLLVFNDILFGYFDENQIRDLHKYMMAVDDLEKAKHDLKNQFNQIKSKDLRNMIDISANTEDEAIKLSDSMIQRIEDELRSRKKFKKIERKAKK